MANFMALVVEDDIFQRDALTELLRQEGLEVIECSTAEAAELVIAGSGNELLALVTDNALAGSMSGVELAEYAKAHFPHIKVVLMSGQPLPHIPKDATFFSKPYQYRELLDAVIH